MKRGTPRHPKTLHLAELINRDVPTAVGYLELLFHFTAEFAPQGDIGRYDDARIEAALHWRGKRGALLEALKTAGWVDEHLSARYATHDWHDHCDDTVRKRLKYNNLDFLSHAGKISGESQKISAPVAENLSLPIPSHPKPSPKPIPIPSQTPTPTATPTPARNGTGTFQSEFEIRLRDSGWEPSPQIFPQLVRIATKAGVEPTMAAVVWMDVHRRSVNVANVKDLTAYMITAFKTELHKLARPSDNGLRKAVHVAV